MKNILSFAFYFVAAIILFNSCSSPLDKPYKKDTIEEDFLNLKNAINEEDVTLLAGYIALKSIGEESFLGKSYMDILKEAKSYQEELRLKSEEEKRLAEKAKTEEAERVKMLGESLTVSVFAKDFFEYNYRDYISYKFVFENKADKDIKAFTGKMVFSDIFDKEIKSLNLTYDEGVSAGSTKKWNAQTEFNQYIDGDVTLKNKELENLKMTWVPEKIIFEDGSVLE